MSLKREWQVIYQLADGRLEELKVWAPTDAAARHQVEKNGLRVTGVTAGPALLDWNQQVFNYQEAAEYLRVSIRSLYRLIETEELEPGANNTFMRRALDAYLTSQKPRIAPPAGVLAGRAA